MRNNANPFLATTCIASVLSTFCPTSKRVERERGRGLEEGGRRESRDREEVRTEEEKRKKKIYKYIYIIYLANLYFWHGNLGQKPDSGLYGFGEEGATLCN